MCKKDADNLRKWLRKRRNSKLFLIYAKACRYLNAQNLSPNIPRSTAFAVTSPTKKFFDAPVELPGELDNVINSILLFCLCSERRDMKISQLAKESQLIHKELVDDLCRMKQELIEQALFLRFLTSCLDNDPYASHDSTFNLYYDCEDLPPDTLEAITAIGKITAESLQSLLDGIALFLQTPVEQISCMPRSAAILLKMTAPCWIFLGLNLPEKEKPAYGRISHLLSLAPQSKQSSTYPALNRILKCLCTAFKNCLAACGGSEFADAMIQRYELSSYVDEKMLSDIQGSFIRASIDWVSTQKPTAVKRALSRRDPDHTHFDRRHYLSKIDDPKEYMQYLLNEAIACIPAHSGPQIKKNFVYLRIFQMILSSIQVKDDDPDRRKTLRYANYKTFNFLLFEHITRLSTIAIRGFGSCNSPNSFFFPPEITQDYDSLEPSVPFKINPFYTPKKSPLDSVNNLEFDLERFHSVQRLRALLFYRLPASGSKGEVQSMQKYLDKLFSVRPLISVYADKEYLGLDPDPSA